MPTHDEVHFDKYTEENKAKHKILGEYLPAYFNALKNNVTGFHYIDGFAGRGSYEGVYPGSPVLVLEKIAEAGLLNRTSVSLVEERPDFLDELRSVIDDNGHSTSLFDSPYMAQGKFSEHVDAILARPIYKKPGRIATFAFVDPCGVDGVRMRDLMRILEKDYGELLLFFNYDGVNRLIGGLEKGTHESRILADLFGSDDAVSTLLEGLGAVANSEKREKIIRCHFVAQLIASGAKYVLPFRFQAKNTSRTSHYLVHCCNNCLGFKFIKHVMWETGRSESDDYGQLEFSEAMSVGGQMNLWRPDIDLKKKEILSDLSRSQYMVGDYIDSKVCEPSDTYSEKVYKTMLMELEASGKLQVFDKNNVEPSPSGKRRKRKGNVTLGDDYWLRSS